MLDFSRLVAMLVVFEGGVGPKGQDGGLYYSFFFVRACWGGGLLDYIRTLPIHDGHTADSDDR